MAPAPGGLAPQRSSASASNQPGHVDHRRRSSALAAGRVDRRDSRDSSIAYVGVPSFVVTLGGLLIWRGVGVRARERSDDRPARPDVPAPRRGAARARSARSLSWIVGGHRLSSFIVFGIVANRRRRRRYGFPVRPMWADVAIGRASGASSSSGAVWVANSLPMAAGTRRGVRRRARHRRSRRAGSSSRPASRIRCSSRSASPLLMAFLAHATPVRTLRVLHRRQPRGRGAGRHQHAPDDHEDVHRDGRAARPSRPSSRPRASNAATSALGTGARAARSSRPPSSAARRSPAASARSPAASWAR